MEVIALLILGMVSLVHSVLFFLKRTRKVIFFVLLMCCSGIFVYSLNIYADLLETGVINSTRYLSWFAMLICLLVPIISFYLEPKISTKLSQK